MKHFRRSEFFSFIIPTCISGILGMYTIGNKSLWLDEILTLRIAGQHWDSMWQTLTTTEPYRWLYYVLLHGWMHFGAGDSYYRSLSLLVGLAAIPGIYVLGNAIGSRRTGAIAAGILAVHPMYLRYLTEVHSYSLLLSLTVWSSYAFWRLLQSWSRGRLVVYLLVSISTVYAHHFGVLVLASHYAFFLFSGRFFDAFRRNLFTVIVIGICLMPLVLYRIPYQNVMWIPFPDRVILTEFVILLSGGHALLAVAAAFLSFIALYRRIDPSVRPSYDGVFLVAISLIFPCVVVLAICYLIRPVFVTRYMIIVLPPLILLISSGLARLSTLHSRLLRMVLVSLMLMSNLLWYTGAPSLARNGFVTYADTEDWKGAVTYVLERSQPGDAIVFFPYFVRYPYEYYRKLQRPDSSPESIEWSSAPYAIGGIMPDPDMDVIRGRAQNHLRTWLVLSHHMNASLGRDRQTGILQKLLRMMYVHADTHEFTGITVTVYY